MGVVKRNKGQREENTQGRGGMMGWTHLHTAVSVVMLPSQSVRENALVDPQNDIL
jgi:hypothetical protein